MEQRELLRKVVAALEGMDVSYMLVGSYGSGAWGWRSSRPRVQERHHNERR